MRDQRRLREYVRLAAQALGSEAIRMPQVERPPLPACQQWRSLLFRSRQQKHQARVEYATDLVRFIAARYGMTLPRVALRFVSLDHPAGRVQLRNGIWYIEIAEKYKSDDEQLASILAHEMAHVLLGSRGIRLDEEIRNEELTDCTAALAGFGRVMLRANERTQVEHYIVYMQRVTTYLGYLRRDALRWIIRVQAHLSQDAPRRRWRRVDPEREGFVECPACATRLRLPAISATILLRCACCGLRQRLKLVREVEPASVWQWILGCLNNWVRKKADRFFGF